MAFFIVKKKAVQWSFKTLFVINSNYLFDFSNLNNYYYGALSEMAGKAK
jgi:hypothetical protein